MNWLRSLIATVIFAAGAGALPADLFDDLQCVQEIDAQLCDRLPLLSNHLLQGGYINMPSARMAREGNMALAYSHVPPYTHWNGRVQPLCNLEITGSYRIFRDYTDPVLSPFGFGDFSDRGLNCKLSVIQPEDTEWLFPGVAIGVDDFLGTKGFEAEYIVATHVFPCYNFECSIGYGSKRLHGFFGGAAWTPFRQCCNYFSGLTLCAEYDSIDYSDPSREPHPDGREQKHALNFGLKYRLWDIFQFSVSQIRGQETAASVAYDYDFGQSCGWFIKSSDPLPYSGPQDNSPLAFSRGELDLVESLVQPFCEQGFDILGASLISSDCGCKSLRLNVLNEHWPYECQVRRRLSTLLAALAPSDIICIIVVLEAEGFPSHEYVFRRQALDIYQRGCMCEFELDTLSPKRDVCPVDSWYCQEIFCPRRCRFTWEILPRTAAFFGSSTGKFQYSLGITAGIQGYIYGDIMYRFYAGQSTFKSFKALGGMDIMNPSQLVNVRSDLGLYWNGSEPRIDELYLQKSWALGCGRFARLAVGHFEVAFGGIAAEFLYAPVNCDWAVGVEYAELRKRDYTGIDFETNLRRFVGFTPVYEKYYPRQAFLNFYYQCTPLGLDLEINAGQFLARDLGARLLLKRRFWNGTTIGVWYTPTDGGDRVNGKRYHDKGILIKLPIHLFRDRSDRDVWEYGISAWLRDVGARADTGKRLYQTLQNERL